jgi:hypothetical protein
MTTYPYKPAVDRNGAFAQYYLLATSLTVMLLLLPVAEGNSGASRTLWQIGGDIPVLVLAFATPMLRTRSATARA